MSATSALSDLAVELRNVSYALDNRQIVSNVSFKVAPGETLVLLGRSGTGKTTTLKLINRLVEPRPERFSLKGARSWNGIPFAYADASAM